ncbi:MAG TPA: hypothetical protein VHV57_09285 [Acidimicrobiales bacterium]|nr:hypothetical protein [Acidimicrobiales bacterium]
MAENDFSNGISAKVLDTVDLVVATVNDKAVRPAVVAARAIVFGVIIALVASLILIVASVGFIRLLNSYATDHHVWIAYLALGALFGLGGAVLYSKRGTTPSP